MPQFRPLPRFDEIEETEPLGVETLPPPGQADETTGEFSALSPQTTGRIPIFLLTGPHPTSTTDQLAALLKHIPATNQPSPGTTALEEALSTTTMTRVVVIPAEVKRKKIAPGEPVKRLKPPVRSAVLWLATVAIVLITMITLIPLSSGQDGMGLLNGISNWIHSAQMDSELQSQINAQPFNPNPANLPTMHIPNSPYVAVAQQAAAAAGISAVYFVRQINQESGFNPDAVSVTDAEGIAQFEPSTAAGLGINPWDPTQALNGAAQLMGRYYRQYGDYAKALGSYNAGSGAVNAAVNACGVNWLSCMPGQTQNYVYMIMGI
jgi:hypothetical protein